jgi:hypothetical protein
MSAIRDEFEQIKRSLSVYFGVFKEVVELGYPVEEVEIGTAAVQFDESGRCIQFKFNPEFYEKLNWEEKLFIYAHESLHVILEHGIRAKNLIANIANIVEDVVINEMLFSMGFSLGKMPTLKAMEPCTLETVFKKHEIKVSPCQNMEYYYDKLMNSGKVKFVTATLLDEHGNLPSLAEDQLKRIANRLPQEDKEKLGDIIKQAGASGGNWFNVVVKHSIKPRWEQIVKDWTRPYMREIWKQNWRTENRRLGNLSKNLFLPNETVIDWNTVKKVDAYFFMDTSGPCYSLASRMLQSARSLPLHRFNARFFSFDTRVEEVNIKTDKLYGGGGTKFDIIERKINEVGAYPDLVFVLTDGDGNTVKPRYPERWHILLTRNGSKNCFPYNVIYHDLEEYA